MPTIRPSGIARSQGRFPDGVAAEHEDCGTAPRASLRWSAHWVGAVDRAGNGALTPSRSPRVFICLPADDLLHLVKKVTAAGIKAKPDLGVIPPDPRTFEWYVKN